MSGPILQPSQKRPGGPDPGSSLHPSSSRWSFAWKAGGGLLLVLLLVIAALVIYASSAHFSNLVRQKVVAVLQDATGGRVEMQAFHWNVRHLTVEVDGLTIRGLEGPGELPYAHLDRLYARAKILSLTGARLGLDYLEVDRPALHLIIYPDGSTNQPHPRTAQTSKNELVSKIFELQAGEVEVRNGLALVNQRVIPFSLAARDVGVKITYAPATQHYLGSFACADITIQQAKAVSVHSKLDVQVEAGRDTFALKALHLVTGKASLDASGGVAHFADPQWSGSANGTVDLQEVSALGLVDGMKQGSVDLSLTAQGRGADQFVVDGKAKIVNASYAMEYFWIDGVNATTHLHITPDEIALTDLVGRPRQGGLVYATLRYLHWSAPDQPAATVLNQGKRSDRPALPLQVMTVRARVEDVRLSTVLASVADPPYRNLGFDTQGTGPVTLDWTGGPDDLTVGAVLTTTAPPTVATGQVPLSGVVDAKYFQRGGRVEIHKLDAHSPASTLNVTGSLGVYPINEPSRLAIHLVNHNLGEFDQVLRVLELGINGNPGIGGLPVVLHSDATFDGTGSGSLIDPAFQGHLTASNFSTTIDLSAPLLAVAPSPAKRPTPAPIVVAWDHLDTNAAYSSSLISVEQMTLSKGKTTIHVSGQLQAHRISRRRQDFDAASVIEGKAQVQDASLADTLAMAGQHLPASGTLNLQAHVSGTLGDPAGGAALFVQGGAIAGQPYHTLDAAVTLSAGQANLTRMTFLQDGGTVVGNGTYDFKSHKFLANLDGSQFQLAHFPQPADGRLSLAGDLKFDAHASGTIESPSVLAGFHLSNLVLGGQAAGAAEAVVHTQGSTAFFTAQNSLAATQLQLKGQTALTGDYATQGDLLLANLNIAPVLRALQTQNVNGSSAIGGTLHFAGPLRMPRLFSGEAVLPRFQVMLQGIALQAVEPLHAQLSNGVLHLSQTHITGPETDLTIGGSAGLTGSQTIAVIASGAVNMKLAQTFDSDITSSGHVDFNVDAEGTMHQPAFSGNLHLNNVALALNDLPNGISKLNGDLIFDENRLQVQNLVGTTGGGQLKLGGFLTYQQGLYGDFTATGKEIRVRYLGISATADTSLHLQGSQNNMLLSGNVQMTRFIIGPNVDFASFAPSATASIPPDANAPSNHVRLDIHVFSAPQLDFQNSYAQLAGSVDLRIRGTLAQPALLGRISVTDGAATFAGTNYHLQHGEIFFTNPVKIEPIIDIDATTRVEEYDVTIGLHGSASQLTPTFRSEPPLPQADVISLLALGRTQEEQSLYSQQEQSIGADSTTNALLGGALNAAVGSRVQKLFGVGSVKIDPTYVGTVGSSSARITVQQNISRNVQVTYATNVNATAQQLIQAQVEVTSSVSVLAVRDEAGVFSLVLKVRKRYR